MTEKKLDKRIVRTRQLLTQAFLELLKERGLQAITVQDITERAAVNRATFYAHFEDKYHLFNTIIDETFQQHLVGGCPLPLNSTWPIYGHSYWWFSNIWDN